MRRPTQEDEGRATLKTVARAVVFGLLRYSGAALLTRRLAQRSRITVLAYHDPAPEVFEAHVARLASLYSIVSLEDVLRAFRDGDARRLPYRALVITLDDGWAGNYDLLRSIQRHGVRPTVFLSTGIVGTHRHFWWTHAADAADAERLKRLSETERLAELETRGYTPETEYADTQALSLAQIVEMAPSVDFQGHGRSHPILPRCTDPRATEEISGCADDIERITGSSPRAFAYPNGDRSGRDVRIVAQSGYECAFTIDTGYNTADTDRYRLRRIYMEDTAGMNELVARASGAYGWLIRLARGVPGDDER